MKDRALSLKQLNTMTKPEIADFYEDLIVDIQALRKREFNSVFYGAIAVAIGLIFIGVSAAFWR